MGGKGGKLQCMYFGFQPQSVQVKSTKFKNCIEVKTKFCCVRGGLANTLDTRHNVTGIANIRSLQETMSENKHG